MGKRHRFRKIVAATAISVSAAFLYPQYQAPFKHISTQQKSERHYARSFAIKKSLTRKHHASRHFNSFALKKMLRNTG